MEFRLCSGTYEAYQDGIIVELEKLLLDMPGIKPDGYKQDIEE